MSHEFFNPVRSVYGAGSLSSLPKLLAGRVWTNPFRNTIRILYVPAARFVNV